MAGVGRRGLVLGGLSALAACGAGRRREGEPRAASEEREQAEAPARESLRVLSYNVLADPVALDERMPALFRAMHGADADVLALQEVGDWFLPLVADSDWMGRYHAARLDGAIARPNGQSIVSRAPVLESRARRLPGAQGRTALISRIALGGPAGEQLALATTHMESFLEDGPIRAAQLDAIFEELERERSDPAVAATIFCGDLNFGDGEQPESAHLDPDFVDLWSALRPGEPGYTWDIERSEMARAGSFVGEGSRRLDRILLRSATWRPAAIEIIGDRPVHPGERGLFPSDHFGLVGEIRRV